MAFVRVGEEVWDINDSLPAAPAPTRDELFRMCFGRGSSPAAALKLKREHPELYNNLRSEAIAAGLASDGPRVLDWSPAAREQRRQEELRRAEGKS